MTVQYRAWRAVSVALQRAPRAVGDGVAVAAGTAAYYGLPRLRRATHANYARVLAGRPHRDVRRTARSSLVNYCRYLADFARFPALEREHIVAAVEGERAFRELDEVLARGRGAVIACMHFGNWDLGAAAAAARGYPLTVIVETFADPRLDQHVVEARRRLGMNIVRMETAGPSLLRTLKRNGLVAVLIDRPVAREGVEVEFFGRPVQVPAGAARLALRTGAQVVPVAFPRLRPGSQTVGVLADFSLAYEPTGDLAGDVRELTQRMMRAHEGFIRRHPEQWYMFREMWGRR